MVHSEVQRVLRVTRQRKWPLMAPQCHQINSVPFPKLNTHQTPPVLNQLLIGEFRKIFKPTEWIVVLKPFFWEMPFPRAVWLLRARVSSYTVRTPPIPSDTQRWACPFTRALFRDSHRLNDTVRWDSLFYLQLSGWYRPATTGWSPLLSRGENVPGANRTSCL